VPGNLLPNLVLFGRLLRGLGLDVNPGRMIDLVQALGYIDLGHKWDFYHAARSLLVHNREDIPLFDQAFRLFWRQPDDGWVMLEMPGPRRKERPRLAPPPMRQPEADGEVHPGQPPAENNPPILEVTRTYSDREVLRRRDFAELTGEEIEAVKRLMSQMVWRLGERRTRRHKTGAGRDIALRQLLRRNLRYGGEILEWPRLERQTRPRPLVVIADISGSMERYTRLLLHFIYSLSAGMESQVEAFVFSTRLSRITRPLRNRDIDRALRDVARAVPDWSGGTRIGDALKSFNFDWARRVLGRGAVVLVISDGWDRGDPELLAREMGRLRRSCYRLIWLNPLLGAPQYEPLTRGIQAALPHIDDFLPIHNLSSLEELANHLAGLVQTRRGAVSPRRPGARE
jgi:uncharacterized protein with von Willebrand factor type A (vWA) domain